VRGERGDVDYDSIESMDLPLVQKHIMQLTRAETVLTPIYNMKTGYRDPGGHEMSLPAGGILVIEGIHALNPDYTAEIAAAEKFRIFISPMSTLQIDDFNVLPPPPPPPLSY
jgi:uridine kinase